MRDEETGLEVISNRTFVNERVDIDGVNFQDCSFSDCIMVFSGKAVFLFERCKTERSQIKYEGAAETTIEALACMYASGMKAYVEGMFELIRNPKWKLPN